MTTTPLRFREIQITREPGPDWTDAQIHTIPYEQTTFTLPTLGATTFFTRTRTVDVYGTASAWSAATTHTTTAGPDSVAVTNEGATVTIDDTGLHVIDGYISIEDEFGEVTLEAGGFSSSWADFIAYGLYNAVLSRGVLGSVPAGRTAALPYWENVLPTSVNVDLITSTSFPGGRRLRFDPTANNAAGSISSDRFPVAAGLWYMPTMYYGYVLGAGGCTQEFLMTVNWYDSDDAFISGTTAFDILISAVGGTGGSITATKTDGPIQAPARAVYGRVDIYVEQLGGTDGGTNLMYLGGATMTPYLSNSAYLNDLTITSDLFFTAGSPSKARLAGFSNGGLYLDTQSNAVDTELLLEATSGQRNYIGMGVEGDTVRRLRLEGNATLTGIEMGTGSATRDLRIHRAGTKTLTFDANTGNLDLVDVDTVVMDYGGALLRASGTSFPGSPTNNDRFYRSDLDQEFFYDGTRWLSTVLYQHQFSPGWGGISATDSTGSGTTRTHPPMLRGGSDIWLVAWQLTYFVNGGTALGASHKWDIAIETLDTSGGTTNPDTKAISSGASTDWRNDGEDAIGALLNNGTTKFVIYLTATKTGTPGTLFGYASLTYRIVAT